MTTESVVNLSKVRALAASGEAKAIRLKHRISLSEIADACQVDQSTVWQWENGGRKPRGEAALRYAGLLDALSEVA